MIDQLKSMAVFAKVVEAGSFRSAAQQLGLSPSVVSHHVSQLEKQLGEPLLHRSTRKLSMTAAGEAFAERCQKMLEAASEGVQILSEKNLRGSLRITVPAVLAVPSFGKLVAGFLEENPGVDLSISFDDRQHNMIEEGYDLSLRAGWLKDSSLKAKKLMDLKHVLVCSPKYMQSNGSPGHPQELNAQDWLGPAGMRRIMLARDREDFVVETSATLKVDSAFAMHSMVLADTGYSLLPSLLIREDLAKGNLVQMLPDWEAKQPSLYAVWPLNVSESAVLRKLIDYLADNASNKINSIE